MNLHNPVDQEYLDTTVLTKESAAHIVYVTWPEDTFYQHLMPVLQSVAAEAEREVALVTAPVSATTDFCEKYQVLFVPTIFLFRRGDLKATLSGFLPVDRLEEIIKDLTNPAGLEAMHEQIEAARQALADGKPAEEIAAILSPEENR